MSLFPAGVMPREPVPGYTIPGVGVPGVPSEEQATRAAVDYGWLIAIVILGLIIKGAITYVTKRIDFKLLMILVVLGAGGYYLGKAA